VAPSPGPGDTASGDAPQEDDDLEIDAQEKVSTLEGFHVLHCVEWLRDKVKLHGHEVQATELSEEMRREVVEFVMSETERRLFAFLDPDTKQLIMQTAVPPDACSDFFYFVRKSGVKRLTPENITESIQFGRVNASGIEGMHSLLRLMNSLYVPLVQGNRTWPESFRKEFAGQLHKFMASLTETAFEMRGSTVLYVPQEDVSNKEASAKDKDLVQRLESTLIHWTRQIKEVVNNQDNSEHAEDAGPLAEIQFWRSRAVDLSGIREQLQRPEVLAIVDVLQQAKSSYLDPFNNLAQSIEQGSLEAQDNLKFLSTLTLPCEKLAKADPKDIPSLLPGILNLVRMIWTLSGHYNTPERLTGLLRQISNEIIDRCCARISLKEIFDGNVEGGVAVLEESIKSGDEWKTIYRKTARLVEEHSANPWNFDESRIFAQIDAFVQRCRDLLEVCESQIQFSQRPGDEEQFAFGGAKGAEIAKSLVDIQLSFDRLIQNLRVLQYNILDVKATKWHDDYNAFKNGVKDLEVMMQNVISIAFDSVSTVAAGVDMLEAFYHLAKREHIKRAIEKKTTHVFEIFMKDINGIKKEFDQRRNPPRHHLHPNYAGACAWAKGLSRRLERETQLLSSTYYLVSSREYEEAVDQSNALSAALEDYIKKTYSDWLGTIDESHARKLESNLLIQPTSAGYLEHNFGKELLRLFDEVRLWEKLRFPIPYVAMEMASQRDKFRVIKENVNTVVRDYNQILYALSMPERRLFQEKLAILNRKITPGLTRLTWISRSIVEYYVRECRKHCKEMFTLVNNFKSNNEKVLKLCKTIADTLLVKIEKKRVYEEGAFEATQAEHRSVVRDKLQKCHDDIKQLMAESYEVFSTDGEDIQREWQRYVAKTDQAVEDSLRTTVKRSLQEIARAINGDARTEVHPIFKVNVVLDKDKVEFKPTMNNLTQMVNFVSKELITVVSVVPCLRGSGSAVDGAAESGAEAAPANFYLRISNDEDILKIMVSIMGGMSSSLDKLQKYLAFWEKYKHIWDYDKDAFIRRYAKANRPLSAFDSDIVRYKEYQNEIQNEETIVTMNFISIDCSPLKQALVAHCVGWQNKFTTLLHTNAISELKDLHNIFSLNTAKLKKPPTNLEMLAEAISLVKRLQDDCGDIEKRFEPLNARFKLLEKFDVAVKEEELELMASLTAEFHKFRQLLTESTKTLDGYKERMKGNLINSLQEFNKHVTDGRAEFSSKGPFDPDLDPEEAIGLVSKFRQDVEKDRDKEARNRAGVDLFGLERPVYKPLEKTEKDLELLDSIWGITRDWNRDWDLWKTGRFSELDTTAMEEAAAKYNKQLQKLSKEIKHWRTWDALKERVEQFKRTMPLIADLRNEALRERHWQQLMDEIGKVFDPKSDDFTLEKVFTLGLDQYSSVINNISSFSSKELMIEKSLDSISETWTAMNMDLIKYKAEMYKVRNTDDLFQALEDNQVTLSTMKASRYAVPFMQQIEHWERTLSHISETMEALLQVQRSWMYLENIFIGSDDIRRQLPAETSMFDAVNTSWKFVMDQLVEAGNVQRGTHIDGLHDMLLSMNAKLDKIQKSLDQYLETKRQAFPRFYFLSNDDLLEILGQARDPMAVQPHLKKCFEAIKTLRMEPPGRDGRRTFEAHAMNSADSEVVAFQSPVIAEGQVELWLIEVEAAMRLTLKRMLFQTLQAMRGSKREKWIKDWPGQLLITAGQVSWTNDCEKALSDVEKGNKNALRLLKKKQISLLTKYSDMVRGQLAKLDRLKLIAVITIEVHARDVIDRMIKAGCNSIQDFEWLSQLRFSWEKDLEDCVVRQTQSQFSYGYEYLGNNGRLVITPLTDRCYMTLTTALHLRRGGNPQGPAGTGKTETVKDLGKAVAKYVIVFNCSDGLDYKSLGRMFSGLCQTGAWSCFDEFNRIDIEVLSVVAQQILAILNAIGEKQDNFKFEGTLIKLDRSCGIFVTMNPGYAGRTELPDNLKALLRPISMMVPDTALIAEIMFFSEGFVNAKVLAKKMTSMYALMMQQLSKQDHYDWGLRAIKSILNASGSVKRADAELAEELILLRTLRDMNMPKLVQDDIKLFNALISDLFPGVEAPAVDYGPLQVAIREEMERQGLQPVPSIILKAIQVFETKLTRHGNMLVGQCGSGKTTSWQVLRRAMGKLKKDNVANMESVKTYVVNPKALSLGELYGEYNLATREWSDGVLSSVMRIACADEKPEQKWLILDGPVDTLWIESMNTVLDDNKLLTLISGERIGMPPQVSLLFEVQDLSVASPATVSRAGMVYYEASELGWMPYVETWLAQRKDQDSVDHLRRLIEKYVQKTLEYKAAECTEYMPISQLNAVQSLCRLFDAVATVDNGVTPDDAENYIKSIEMWFAFSVVWSLGAAVDEEGRKKMDIFFREVDAQFPSRNTVYDYCVDTKKKQWLPWQEKLSATWRPLPDTPFFKLLVPTVDYVRNSFVVGALCRADLHVMIMGVVGCGKTSLVQQVLSGLDEGYLTLNMQFSSRTSSNKVQEIFESRVEKRTKDVFAPPAGKKMVCFVDDVNMPAKDTFGSMPPLELLRQWMEHGFWYDRAKQSARYIKDVRLVCAGGPPGGGRSVLPTRFSMKFNHINFTFPDDNEVRRIYGTLINLKLTEFDDDIKPLGDIMTQATMEIFQTVSSELLPTPARSHYVFNMRDMSKVFQGVLQATRDFFDSRDSMTRLWVHECFRVFHDRLVDDEDRLWFKKLVDDKLTNLFSSTWKSLFKAQGVPVFCDFMREMDNPPYEEVSDFSALKTFVEEKLDDYNTEPGLVSMHLVMFRDALEHLARISRIIKLPRGHALLVGVGGSGRQSVSKLAAYIQGYSSFQIEISRTYGHENFREDLKKLFHTSGVQGKPTVFIFTDTQIVNEAFVEDINSLLGSGEVPNLYAADETAAIRDAVRFDAKKAGYQETPEQLMQFFIDRCRDNLHLVLCFSPIGDAFRNRTRMFPNLVNCTTIDWFSEWPSEALKEVALRFLGNMDLGSPETTVAVADVFKVVQASVVTMSQRLLDQLKRHNYVTPTNYLELVQGYIALLNEKRKLLGDQVDKLRNGILKLDEARTTTQEMSVILEEKKKDVVVSQKECEELLVVIVQDRRTVDEQAKQVQADSEKIAKEEAILKVQKDEAQKDLDEALPALQMAEELLKGLNKKDIAEIKAYAKAPELVELTLTAVLTLKKCASTDWSEAKRQLGDPNFLMTLMTFDKDTLNDALLHKISKFTNHPSFYPDMVGKQSLAAKSLCAWVRAMEQFGKISKVVAPKREKLRSSEEQLEKKQTLHRQQMQKLQEVQDRMQALKANYDESVARKDQMKREGEELETKLDRAQKMVSGLAGERVRWLEKANLLDIDIQNLPGDCCVAAAFLSYAGFFISEFRREMVDEIWSPHVKQLAIPCSETFSFHTFLADPTDVRDWNLQGLPSDAFSTENGVLVTRGRRWPLMIDPQGQANKWVKNLEGPRGLKVLDLKMGDWMRQMEAAIQYGTPVLMQDILEELDPALEPVLGKCVTKKGNSMLIKLGDKELDYNPEFKFYLTTKLHNPHYTPEVSTKCTMVNFAVKEEGLEEQVLGLVVKKERPDLEDKKQELVKKLAEGKRTLEEMEDTILRLLQSAKGSLVDDEQLVNTLQTSKSTAEEVTQQMIVAEQTEKNIDAARETYRGCAVRSALLYFVINDMAVIDPMYQFSLDFYFALFGTSIDRAPKSEQIEERIKHLNTTHTSSVYRTICRSLFERHKLLFSLQMCVKIMQRGSKMNKEEYNFFLRGGTVLDRSSQSPNPAPEWINESNWDNISELEKLANFRNIVTSFEQNSQEWRLWYQSSEPEVSALPGEWENKCNELQRLILLRCLRADRLVFAVTTFVVNNLGPKFVEPPPFELDVIYADSNPVTPLIFVLSPGVDPVNMLQSLATQINMGDKFFMLALGQGQGPIATKLVTEGVQKGHWIFLANCHLCISFMPELEKIYENLALRKPHKMFRLWLSSNPHPNFPISILQGGIKMTSEPPRGLKANLIRLYNRMPEPHFNRSAKPHKYKKLLFALCYFHSVLLERRKFMNLGWNVPYDFNDSDYDICENILCLYLDAYEETPWESIKYLIAEANYGGRVTDDWDRRLMLSYINHYICPEALSQANYKLSSLPTYYIPDDGGLQSYKDHINALPNFDAPEAFGQHGNADIASQIEDSRSLLDAVLSMQPSVVVASGETPEEKVHAMAGDIIAHLPERTNIAEIHVLKADDPSALHTVLFQEIERYNALLLLVSTTLSNLQRAIKGLMVMTPELDEVFQFLYDSRVPAMWQAAYPSQKPLAPWTRDLQLRVEQLAVWGLEGYPKVYWMSGFTFPTGFLTAVLQTCARKNNISIDMLSWEFVIVNQQEKDILQGPKEGVYIKGLFLEGAGWNHDHGVLAEPSPMELVVPMPILHLKPVESKKKFNKGMYSCPCYYFPVRTGTRERPSFILAVDLKSGNSEPDHWVKRGTALLCSLPV